MEIKGLFHTFFWLDHAQKRCEKVGESYELYIVLVKEDTPKLIRISQFYYKMYKNIISLEFISQNEQKLICSIFRTFSERFFLMVASITHWWNIFLRYFKNNLSENVPKILHINFYSFWIRISWELFLYVFYSRIVRFWRIFWVSSLKIPHETKNTN